MKKSDKNQIARKYGFDNGYVFGRILESLNEIRNIASHHDRLWNIRLSRVAPELDANVFGQKLDNKRPFFYFCVMKMMLNVLSPHSEWGVRVLDLLRNFPENSSENIRLEKFGAIVGYAELDVWTNKNHRL